MKGFLNKQCSKFYCFSKAASAKLVIQQFAPQVDVALKLR